MCDCVFPDERVILSQKIHPYIKYYSRWYSMLDRCYNVERKDFDNYGARGIKVCIQWMVDFQQYVRDIGKKPDGCTLDRIDNDKGYCPHNIKWSSLCEQNANRRALKKKSDLPVGVYKTKNGFISQIRIQRKIHYLGSGKDAEALSNLFKQVYFENYGKMPS